MFCINFTAQHAASHCSRGGYIPRMLEGLKSFAAGALGAGDEDMASSGSVDEEWCLRFEEAINNLDEDAAKAAARDPERIQFSESCAAMRASTTVALAAAKDESSSAGNDADQTTIVNLKISLAVVATLLAVAILLVLLLVVYTTHAAGQAVLGKPAADVNANDHHFVQSAASYASMRQSKMSISEI